MRPILLSICLLLLVSPAWASPAATNGAVPIPIPGKAMPESDSSADNAAFPGLDDLMARAKNGEPGAEEALGNRYEKGNGVEQDYAEAAKWYRMAAEQGFTKAEAELGILYSKGLGVKLDYEEAYFWLSMSFDPFKPDENKVLEEIKSYLSSEQQEIVNNRVNSWKPSKKFNTASANGGEGKLLECSAIKDLVGNLAIKTRASFACKDAYKNVKYACSGQEMTCKGCHDAFINYQSTCMEQGQPTNQAYSCIDNSDCGLVDTNCGEAYDPVSVNRQFMGEERTRHNWPSEGCGRKLEILHQFRPVCVKQQCSVEAAQDSPE